MKAPIDNSIALITGASSGIGAALALEIAPRAKALLLVARREEKLLELKQRLLKINGKLRVEIYACDISDHKAVDRMLEKVKQDVGVVDILMNNAGMGDLALFDRADWNKLERMIELNVLALTYLTHRLLGPMLQMRRGGILMVGSTAGMQALPSFGTYCATKFYVRGFSEALRAEVSSKGVVVSQLCPGPVATEFEAVAMDGGKLSVPSLIEISAEKCAREAIHGFERGKAVVIPGLLQRILMMLHKMTPEWILRPILVLLTRQIDRAGAFARKS